MDKDKIIADLNAALAKAAVDHAAELSRVKAFAALSDADRAHAKSLDADDREAFLAKSATDREAIRKANVIHTSPSGTVFVKGQEALVELVKSNETLVAQVQIEKAKNADLEITKAVAATIPALKGADPVKAALMKAVNGIADETVRAGVIESLKAANDAALRLTKAAGIGRSQPKAKTEAGTASEPDAESARGALTAYVAEKAVEMKVSPEVAFSKLAVDSDAKFAKLYNAAQATPLEETADAVDSDDDAE